MAIKLNIGDPKSKKSVQIELDEQNSQGLMGKKIGETFKGELVDKAGYEFTITGGSDKAGFPMRNDVEGDHRRKILIPTGIGNRKRRKGMRLRRTVTGNTIGVTIAQVNVKVVKAGKQPLIEKAPSEGGDAPTEAPKAEEKKGPAKEKKEAPKAKPKEKPEAEEKAKPDKE